MTGVAPAAAAARLPEELLAGNTIQIPNCVATVTLMEWPAASDGGLPATNTALTSE
jgi:hypothetical protein